MTNPSTTPMNERDEARTPPSLFKKLNDIYDFNIDLASTEDNALCDRFYTKEIDFLSDRIHLQKGTIGYVNPPYSRELVALFIKKCYEETLAADVTVVMLLPMDSSTVAFHECCIHATDWYIFRPRVRFLRPNGTPFTGSPKFGSFACVFQNVNTGFRFPVIHSMRWK